jgi:hypothetical protein
VTAAAQLKAVRQHPWASLYVQLKKRFTDYYARTKHIDVEWKSAFVAKVLELAKDEKKR